MESSDLQGSGSVYEKEKTYNIGTGNKLVITKLWFSKSQILNTQDESFTSNPMSDASVSYHVRPSKTPFISSSHNI